MAERRDLYWGAMRERIISRMAIRTLLRRRTRSILTVLGVAVGILVVTAFLGIVEGLLIATEDALHIGDTDITVFDARASADLLSTLDEKAVRARLLETEGIREVSASLWSLLPASGTPFLFVQGLHKGEFMLESRTLIEGRGIEGEDEILLGRGAARTLKRTVGDTLEVVGKPLHVVGIYETGIVYTDQAAILPLPRLQEMAKRPGLVTVFYVRVDPGADPAQVAERIEAGNDDIVAIRSVEEYEKVDQGIRLVRGAKWMISVLAVFVGIIGVMNTMWTSVFERTREIGTLRAVGWRKRQVMFTIGLEAVMVSLAGGLLGIAGGVLTANLLARLPWAEQFLSPAFPPKILVWAGLVALLTGVFGGLYPAYRASRLSPVEALRYE